jgi:tryptophanyl-tRNA synthetase
MVVAAVVGQEVTVTSRSMGSIIWKVVALVNPVNIIPEKDSSAVYGLQGFDVGKFKKSDVISNIFLRLMFKNWRSKVKKMNMMPCWLRKQRRDNFLRLSF